MQYLGSDFLLKSSERQRELRELLSPKGRKDRRRMPLPELLSYAKIKYILNLEQFLLSFKIGLHL